jgi:hypothetical protein
MLRIRRKGTRQVEHRFVEFGCDLIGPLDATRSIGSNQKVSEKRQYKEALDQLPGTE